MSGKIPPRHEAESPSFKIGEDSPGSCYANRYIHQMGDHKDSFSSYNHKSLKIDIKQCLSGKLVSCQSLMSMRSPHTPNTYMNINKFARSNTKKTTVIEQNDGTFRFGKYYGIKILGEGSFGKVYQALKTDNNVKCAIKVINKENMLRDIQKGLKTEINVNDVTNLIKHEIEIQQTVSDCDNVCNILDYQNDAERNYSFIVTELVEGGCLFTKPFWKKYNKDYINEIKEFKESLTENELEKVNKEKNFI